MGRPRTISDEEILAAVGRVVQSVGPIRMTLAQVGKEARISAPALVQRFGSKRGLLLAFVDASVGEVSEAFAAARAKKPSPLDALLDALALQMRPPASAAEVASGLAFLQVDLTEDDFRDATRRYFERFHEEVLKLLHAAKRARELRRNAVPEALARAIEVAYNGSQLTWAIHEDGTSSSAIRRDVGAVLAPWRARTSGVTPGRLKPRFSP